MHGQTGSIYKHFYDTHHCKPTRELLTENTTIIARDVNRYRLGIKEALLIIHNAPSLNVQFDNFTNILKLHHRNISQRDSQHIFNFSVEPKNNTNTNNRFQSPTKLQVNNIESPPTHFP